MSVKYSEHRLAGLKRREASDPPLPSWAADYLAAFDAFLKPDPGYPVAARIGARQRMRQALPLDCPGLVDDVEGIGLVPRKFEM
jgi:hypothetical protein